MAHVLTRQEHPLVFVISHWVNLICMVVLIFTGFYIHWPFIDGVMSVMRGAHIVGFWVLLANLLFRLVSAFMVKDVVDATTGEVGADIKTFLPQKVNKGQMWNWIGYYLFFKKDKPETGKYGNLQKIAYDVVPFMILAAAFTGFSIYPPTFEIWPFSWAVSQWGLMNLRSAHYIIMWVIIVFSMIHIYLASIFGFQPWKLMFLWRQPSHIPDTEKGLVGTGWSVMTIKEFEDKTGDAPLVPLEDAKARV